MNFVRVILFGLVCSLVFPKQVQAIPPPDFIFQAGSQAGQILSVLAVVGSATIAVLMKWSGSFLGKIGRAKLTLFFLVFIALTVLASMSFLVSSWSERRAMDDFNRGVQVSLASGIEKYDVISQGSIQSAQPGDDLNADQKFIVRYYANIGSGDVSSAYGVSKRNVPFEVYKSWYEKTTDASVYGISQIGEREYAFTVDLFEESNVVRYAITMTLAGEAESTRIASSQVRVLTGGTGDPLVEGASRVIDMTGQESGNGVVITNEEFSRVDLNNGLVLDAREDEEYEIGRYPGSTHVRFADLLAGAWINLPIDREIYVICWSGLRGREVAEYLRGKGLTARYLEDGASGWVTYGGLWEGGISFSKSYSAERYSLTFSTDEVKERLKKGILLVDVRDARTKEFRTIPGSVNVSSIFTATEELKDKLTSVPSSNGVVTVCDDFLSCFDARIVGIKLEKLGHVFLGRYVAPYEF